MFSAFSDKFFNVWAIILENSVSGDASKPAVCVAASANLCMFSPSCSTENVPSEPEIIYKYAWENPFALTWKFSNEFWNIKKFIYY